MRDGDPTAAECASTPPDEMDCASREAADEPEPQTEALSHEQARTTSHEQPMPGSKSGQIEEVLAAMAAVPAHPPTAFVQRQLSLLGRLQGLLGCNSELSSWLRASSMLPAEQAFAIFHVAMRAESSDGQADDLVSEAGHCLRGTQPRPRTKVLRRCLQPAHTSSLS